MHPGRKKRMLRLIFGGIGAVMLTAVLVMVLWNALVPEIIGGPVISYLQALGILVLAKLLFTGWIPGRGRRGRCGSRRAHHWKKKMREKMKSMSPEERAKFKKGFEDAFQGKWDVNVFEVEEDNEEYTDERIPPEDQTEINEKGSNVEEDENNLNNPRNDA